MTRPAQHLLMALAFDVYWTLVVMLRERGLLIWLTLALFAWLRLPAASRPPALLLAAAGCGLDACWALAGLIDFPGDSLLPLWMVALWLMFAVVWRDAKCPFARMLYAPSGTPCKSATSSRSLR